MKKKMTVLCGLLMAVVITAYSVSGTYAKYTSSMSTTDTARVARWGINVGEKTKLGLFEASYGAGNEIASADNGDGTHDLVVAPGATGKVDIAVSGTSEVAYKLSVKAEVTNNVLYTTGVSPIKFRIGTGAWTELTKANLEAQLKTELGENDYAANSSVNKTVTLEWKWAFDVTDLENNMGITPVTDFDYDVEDTKLGTKFQGTVITDEDAFTAVVAADSTWSTMGWSSFSDVPSGAQSAVKAAMDAYKAANSTASDPNITITLDITATQIAPTA